MPRILFLILLLFSLLISWSIAKAVCDYNWSSCYPSYCGAGDGCDCGMGNTCCTYCDCNEECGTGRTCSGGVCISATTCPSSVCGGHCGDYSAYPSYRFYGLRCTGSCYWFCSYSCGYYYYEYCPYGCSGGACLSAPTDTTPPTGSLSVSPTAVTTGQTITITVTGYDNKDVGSVYAHFGGSWKSYTCSGVQTACSYTWYHSESTPGSYTYTGYVDDAAGNDAYTTPSTVTVTVVSPDTTPPVSTITSPAAGSWQRTNFSVSVTDSDTGGSGLATCYYHVYDSVAGWTKSWQTRTCNSSFTVTVGSTADCRTQGSNKCTVYVLAKDNAGNESSNTTRAFSIDYTTPNTPSIDSPPAGSTQSWDFSVSVSGDGDTGGSGLSACYYDVYDSGVVYTKSGATRTCNSSFTVTVGSGKDCRTNGGTCTVYAYAKDGAGNTGTKDSRNFNISLPVCSPLNYPTTKWQRVWYDYDWNCLGDGPDETAIDFDNNWIGGTIAYAKSDYIIFNSSRSINFATAGPYKFTVGSDDGIRLWIDGVLKVDDWNTHSYTTHTFSVTLSAGWHNFELHYFEATGNARVSFDHTFAQDEVDCNTECVRRGYGLGDCRLTWETSFCTDYTYADPIGAVGACTSPLYDVICYCCHNCGSAPVDTVTVGPATVTIQGRGWDATDGVIGGYRRFNKDSTWRELAMDDNLGDGACNENINFKNSWSVSGNTITIRTDILAKSATNDLGAGFVFDSGGYPFCASLVGIADNGNMNVIGSGCYPASIATLGTTKGAEAGEYLTWYIDLTVDTTPPTTVIEIKRKSTGLPPTESWLRADTYTIQFTDSDNVGGSGLKSCGYYINSCNTDGTNCTTPVVPDQARTCNEPKDISLGTSPYTLEGRRYFIYGYATDNVNLSGSDSVILWTDFTAPVLK